MILIKRLLKEMFQGDLNYMIVSFNCFVCGSSYYWMFRSTENSILKGSLMSGVIGGLTTVLLKRIISENCREELTLNPPLHIEPKIPLRSDAQTNTIKIDKLSQLPIILKYISLALQTKNIDKEENMEAITFFNQKKYSDMDIIALEKREFNDTVKMYTNMFYETLLEIKAFQSQSCKLKTEKTEIEEWLFKFQDIVCKYMPAVDRANLNDKRFSTIPNQTYPIENISFKRIQKAFEYLMQHVSSFVTETNRNQRHAMFLVSIQSFCNENYLEESN